MEKVFLVDAYALIFRFYYAFIGRPMRNAAGVNTSAVFGFVKFLKDLILRERPHYLGVAFDPPGGNFRHELYADYKANRSETPEDIVASVPYIKQVLEAMRIPVLEIPGYEADDVIGTLSQKAAAAGYEVFMVTPDKDYGQLIRPAVRIYKQRKGGADGIEIIGCEQIREHYGIDDPCRVIDVLALWGDASDNIPGVQGIGEKSAIKLVCQFGTVENLLAHTELLSGKQRVNIEAARDQIMLAKRLATIRLDVPVEFEPEKLRLEAPDTERLAEAYRELGFRSFLAELRPGAAETAEKSEPASPQQSKSKTAVPARDLFSAQETPAVPAEGSLFDAPAYQTIDTVPHVYHTVTDEKALRELAGRLEASSEFCFDTETTGFDVFGDRLVGLSFAVEPFEAWYVPCDPANLGQVLSILRPVFENERIAKIGQNVKFDLMMLRSAGIDVRGTLYDTMIVHYLLDPESRHGMDHLARICLNYSPVPIEELIGKGARQITMDRVPVERCARYAAEDADVTLRLKRHLWPRLEEAGLTELYLRIEEPLIRVLADIEMTGVKIDSEALAASGRELTSELAGLEDRIREMTGDPSLNVNSAKQLGDALFGRMKIDPKPRMTKTKQYRTDEEYLQMLADRHPVIGLILEYRGLRKLLSTYVEALPQLVNPRTGRIHTSFNQAVTATGRLSSTNPNLQNIPVRMELGRLIRKAFVPKPGCVFLDADYSQIELRVLAHMSGDENLIEAYREAEDIHRMTASKVFHVPLEEVTPLQRRNAKAVNFGIVYGISSFGLGQDLGISRKEAEAYIQQYFETYPGIHEFLNRCVEDAKEKGYSVTMFGRRRPMPELKSSNFMQRSFGERVAMNAPIQGTAADIIKIAMIRVAKRLKEEQLKTRLLLQVHDELLLEVPEDELEKAEQILEEEMTGAAHLAVKLEIDMHTGNNWYEAK